jgi:hypothetical protein
MVRVEPNAVVVIHPTRLLWASLRNWKRVVFHCEQRRGTKGGISFAAFLTLWEGVAMLRPCGAARWLRLLGGAVRLVRTAPTASSFKRVGR